MRGARDAGVLVAICLLALWYQFVAGYVETFLYETRRSASMLAWFWKVGGMSRW